jgi:hypothetical protein
VKIITTSLVLSLLVCSCTTPPALPEGEKIGEDIVAQETVLFATAHSNPTAYYNKTLLVEATATAVCQSKGCWIQIEDQGEQAMVRWETGCDGKYAFPKDLAGQRVLIQGSFYPKTISEEDAKHLEEEAGKGLKIERETYELNASAILVLKEEKTER